MKNGFRSFSKAESHLVKITGFSGLNGTMDKKDEILEFGKGNPMFEEAFLRFGEILFEYELEGKIQRQNGRIKAV